MARFAHAPIPEHIRMWVHTCDVPSQCHSLALVINRGTSETDSPLSGCPLHRSRSLTTWRTTPTATNAPPVDRVDSKSEWCACVWKKMEEKGGGELSSEVLAHVGLVRRVRLRIPKALLVRKLFRRWIRIDYSNVGVMIVFSVNNDRLIEMDNFRYSI